MTNMMNGYYAYSTPCGWCTKWDKKCDNNNQQKEYVTNVGCNHDWEYYEVNTAGTQYRCTKCGMTKTEPVTFTVIH